MPSRVRDLKPKLDPDKKSPAGAGLLTAIIRKI